MMTLQSFEIFETTYLVAEDNVLGDLNRHGSFIQECFLCSYISHFKISS